MRNIVLVFFLSLESGFVLYGQNPQIQIEQNAAKGWKTINEKEYSIQYPDSFEVDKSGLLGVSFMILSKQTSQKDLFRENVNLLIQDLKGKNIDLDRYVDITVGQISRVIKDGVLIDSKRVKNADSEYQRIIYTGKQNEFNLKWLQYYWIKNEKAYLLTLTCEINQYDKYGKVGEEIMKTFKLKK